MSTHFDLSTYIYSNLLNSKNVPQQFSTAIANSCGKILLRLLRPNFEGWVNMLHQGPCYNLYIESKIYKFFQNVSLS